MSFNLLSLEAVKFKYNCFGCLIRDKYSG